MVEKLEYLKKNTPGIAKDISRICEPVRDEVIAYQSDLVKEPENRDRESTEPWPHRSFCSLSPEAILRLASDDILRDANLRRKSVSFI